MGFQVKALNACKLVSISAKSYTGASTGELQFSNTLTGSSLTKTITYGAGSTAGRLNVTLDDLGGFGFYIVSLKEGGVEVARRPLLLHCDIDCCLTKLTNELIDCACDCPKCASSLAKAQKVFLLLQSALSTADIMSGSSDSFNSGFYQDISDKYEKAKEICDNSCGCDC